MDRETEHKVNTFYIGWTKEFFWYCHTNTYANSMVPVSAAGAVHSKEMVVLSLLL